MMRREKVKLEYIVKNSKRKTTFNKRINGFMKKAEEISTLCDIKACAVVYNPFDSTVHMWPREPGGVQRVISEFMTYPAIARERKMYDQEGYLREMVEKAKEKLNKKRNANRKEEMDEALIQFLEGNINNIRTNDLRDLKDLCSLIEQYQKDINRRIETIRDSGRGTSNAVSPTERIGPLAIPPVPRFCEGSSSSSPANARSLFNSSYHQDHQVLHHPNAPYIQPLNINQNRIRDQNHVVQMSYAPEQMRRSFMEDRQDYRNHHFQTQQQQQQHGDSSSETAADNSSSGSRHC